MAILRAYTTRPLTVLIDCSKRIFLYHQSWDKNVNLYTVERLHVVKYRITYTQLSSLSIRFFKYYTKGYCLSEREI